MDEKGQKPTGSCIQVFKPILIFSLQGWSLVGLNALDPRNPPRLGEGTFSTVFRCRDAAGAGEVGYAVKFTKSNEQTRKALEREVPGAGGWVGGWVEGWLDVWCPCSFFFLDRKVHESS